MSGSRQVAWALDEDLVLAEVVCGILEKVAHN